MKINQVDKKIFLNVGYQVIGKFLTSVLGFIASILLARFLGVTLFGEYSLIYILLGLTGIFGDFGLGTLLTREVAAKRADRVYLSATFSLRLVLLLIITAVSTLFLIFTTFSTTVKQGVFLALVGNVFLSLSSIYWAVFQARLEFIKVVLIQIVSSVTFLVLVFFGVRNGWPTLFYVFSGLSGNLLGFALSAKFAPKLGLFFDKKVFLKIFKEVWPIGLGAIVTTFYFKIDSLFLSLFFNPAYHDDLGLYSASYKFFEVASIFAGFFQMTTFPIISSKLERRNFDKVYRKLLFYALSIALCSMTGLFVLAKPLLLIMGENFLPAANSLKILSLALGFMVVGGFWVSVAVAGGRQKTLFWLSCLALILNVLSNLFVIPKCSFIGASWITVVTQGFIALTGLLVASQVIKFRK
jgi:O-antigen/teichoic acid export membrane protein